MLKIMTWNIENLFPAGHESGPPTPAAFDAKIHELARVINEQEPDVLAVQEVGDPGSLDQLVALLDGDWQTRLSTHPDTRGIRVAVLSRHPLTSSEDVLNFPAGLAPIQTGDGPTTESTMGRGAVAVTVDLGDDKSFVLLTAHLKSKLLTFPGGAHQPADEDQRARFAAYALYRRAAEATTVRAWATATLDNDGQSRRVIVLGDFNDSPEAATTQLMLGPPGSEIGTPGFATPDQGDKQRLWNLAPAMPAGANFSRVFHGKEELIDHILVSKALVDHLDTVKAVIPQPLPSVTNDPTVRRNDPASDHAPIVATFDV
jgi:endonuclease/exonuclease/phosphatase family metal-dependent hydrolase